MPRDVALMVAAIALPFIVFAIVLACTDYWTQKAH